MSLAHHQIHVLITTMFQFHAPQTAQITMVTQNLVRLNAMMIMKFQYSVHLDQLQHGNCFVTNLDHALIHQIQSGVNSTNPINHSLLNKFKLQHHKHLQFHLLMPHLVQICKLH